jgi:exopolysaccharide biosynthesis polyprenyl glycosylphosphotransferase
VFDRHQQKAVLLFAIADVILTVIAFEAAYQTRLALPLSRVFFITTPVKALLLVSILVLWLLLGRWIGTYERLYGADFRAAVYDTLRQITFGAFGLAMFIFVMKLDISRPFIGLFLFYDLTLLLLYRTSAGRLRGWVRRQFGAEFSYVVVGERNRALELIHRLDKAEEYGAKLLAAVDLSTTPDASGQGFNGYPLKELSDLPQLLRSHAVDEVFFAVEAARLGDLEEIFLMCDEQGIRSRVATNFFPHVNSHIFLDRFGGYPLLTFTTSPHDETRLLLKRILDITCSLFALIVLALPMLAIALLVRMTSPGAALFKQKRLGLNGRPFTFYKFRSMVENAEQLREQVEHLNEKDGPVFKISRDPRLTRIGGLLRRYSIDEWPQFWNVLKGDMSFVGPRPAVATEVEQYESWQRRRLRMRPGLTCLWALHGRDQLEFETWMRLDLEYIDNWSLSLDLKILLHSIPAVLVGRGAH